MWYSEKHARKADTRHKYLTIAAFETDYQRQTRTLTRNVTHHLIHIAKTPRLIYVVVHRLHAKHKKYQVLYCCPLSAATYFYALFSFLISLIPVPAETCFSFLYLEALKDSV